MPPPAQPAGQPSAQVAAGQKPGQPAQDATGAAKTADATNGAGKPADGPLAAVESLPAQIARPVIKTVVTALGQVFRLDPVELKRLLAEIAD